MCEGHVSAAAAFFFSFFFLRGGVKFEGILTAGFDSFFTLEMSFWIITSDRTK